jgi:hypothetical protein
MLNNRTQSHTFFKKQNQVNFANIVLFLLNPIENSKKKNTIEARAPIPFYSWLFFMLSDDMYTFPFLQHSRPLSSDDC